MDREYLEDYEQRENTELDQYWKEMEKGQFSFEKNKYPPDQRFIKLHRPVALATGIDTIRMSNVWTQVPFCGSLILLLDPFPRLIFEETHFKISEIPKIIDFVKETGKIQIALSSEPTKYEGLDFLDPFFTELNPPVCLGAPFHILGSRKELQKAQATYFTLGNVRLFDHYRSKGPTRVIFQKALEEDAQGYAVLKLCRYTVAEEIENLIIDDPAKASSLLLACRKFISTPVMDMRSDMRNYTFEDVRLGKDLPLVYRPQKLQFPCEIGKFLLEKLTYAPQGMDACKELIYHYNAYDLRKVQESLSEAIITNHPDIVNRSTEELSEILDNIWSDKTIPRRVKGLQVGIPLSMAAIGSVAAGPIGAAGGFLAGLGYSVLDKFIDLGTEGLSEKVAKLKTRSYQANVYDFKQKYKHRIVQDKSK